MPDVSPYAPPRADEYAAAPIQQYDLGLQDASQGTRLANFFLDSIGRSVFAIAAMIPFALFKSDTVGTVGAIALLLALPGYYFLFEATLGRTPAKFLTGTRVVSTNGGRPSAAQILGRSLARFVPFEPFSFLFGGNPPSGWHDKWSNTRVVKI